MGPADGDYNTSRPLTVFDIKGVPGTRRERIEAAVVAGGIVAHALFTIALFKEATEDPMTTLEHSALLDRSNGPSPQVVGDPEGTFQSATRPINRG